MRASIMLSRIMMKFLNRTEEIARLRRVTGRRQAGLVVVYGRRRIGKTRLLLAWSSQAGGLYTVADQSAAEIQRRYLAETVAARLPGFAAVDYPDWTSLLTRLARDAEAARWRGPLIFDELPYLVTASPEIPSVLQRGCKHATLWKICNARASAPPSFRRPRAGRPPCALGSGRRARPTSRPGY